MIMRVKKFDLKFVIDVFVCIFNLLASPANSAVYQSITSNDISQLIAKDQRVKLVFIFTSWCPYCKKGYESLVSIAEKYNSKQLLTIPISVDEKTADLEAFLKQYAKIDIIPNNYKLQDANIEVTKLSGLGINFGGSIPHVALLDNDNQVIIEGRFDDKYLKALISLLIKNK
jgi:thiol-disulfide isomerase/thioredoxin